MATATATTHHRPTTGPDVIDLCPKVIDLCGPPASAAVKPAGGRKRKPADGSGGGDAARQRSVVPVPVHDLLSMVRLCLPHLPDLYTRWGNDKKQSEWHPTAAHRVKGIINEVDNALRTVCDKACVSSVRKLALRTRGARSADGAGGVRSGGGEPDHDEPWLTDVYSSGSPWAPTRPPAVDVGDDDDDDDDSFELRDPFQPLRAMTPLLEVYSAIAKVAMSPGVVKAALDVLYKMIDVVPLRCWVFFHQDGEPVDGGTTVGGHAVNGDWRDAALVRMLDEYDVGYWYIGFKLLEAGSDAGSVPTSTGLLQNQVLGPEDFSGLLRLGILYAFSALVQYGSSGRFYKDGRGRSKLAARQWLMELVHSGRLRNDDDADGYYDHYGDHVPWSLAGLLLDALYRDAHWPKLEDLVADKRAKFIGRQQ